MEHAEAEWQNLGRYLADFPDSEINTRGFGEVDESGFMNAFLEHYLARILPNPEYGHTKRPTALCAGDVGGNNC